MLRISLYQADLYLSSNLTDIIIYTDNDFVDVKLSADGFELIAGRYYALNGYVTVPNVGELITQFIAGDTDVNMALCTIEASTPSERTSMSINVMYCDRDVSVSDMSTWFKENFLTLTRVKRIASDDNIRLWWYTTETEGIAVMVYATFLGPDGSRDVYQYVHSGNGLIAHVNDVMGTYIFQEDIINRIKSAKKIDSLTLQSVTVRCKNRSVTFFIDPTLDGCRKFYFLNCFNILECLIFQAETTAKIKSDRSIANVGKGSSFYDVTNSKEYETETAALSPDDSVLIEQMLISPKVKIQWGENSIGDEDFDAMSEILITDFTCELSDNDLNKVKFTWQFDLNTPKAELPTTPGIFNDKYNPVFS